MKKKKQQVASKPFKLIAHFDEEHPVWIIYRGVHLRIPGVWRKLSNPPRLEIVEVGGGETA